jgi:hypothetical protein
MITGIDVYLLLGTHLLFLVIGMLLSKWFSKKEVEK